MLKNLLRSPKTVGCVLALITLALFWPATRSGFIELDDENYVSGNPYVQQSFTRQSLAWATTAVHESYWLPVTWISFIIDRAVQGPEPMGYHRTNVLLHAANVVLLFFVGYRLTGNPWGSALLAALFGWHPLRVEAVVWISSRKDVLSTFFGLLAILAYVRYVRIRRRGARWGPSYLLIVIAMAAGLMAKPMLVTLPFVLLLLDFWPLKRFGWPGERTASAFPVNREENFQRSTLNVKRSKLDVGRSTFSAQLRSSMRECFGRILSKNRDAPSPLPSPPLRAGERVPGGRVGGRFKHVLLEKVPLLLVAAVFIFITLSTHQSSGSMHRLDTVSLVDHLAHIPANYCRYLWKIFWPVDLAVRYPPLRVPLRESLALGGLVVVWTAFCFWWSRRWPWALVGWLWFLGTFVPIIGLVRIGTADFADRFTYVPSMGISLLATGAILSVFPRRWGLARIIAAAILLATCALATRHQMQFWADGETLFRRALQVTRNNATAHNALGRALEKQGRWQEAMLEYRESLSIAPGFGQAHANLGNVLGVLRRHDEAASHFQAALQGTAEDAKVHSNFGSILYESGQKAEGVRHLREAIRLNPHLSDAHFNLGRALLETGEEAGALDHFIAAARINPDDDAAQFQAGRLYLAQGNMERARSCFEAALRRQPDNLEYVQALREAAILNK